MKNLILAITLFAALPYSAFAYNGSVIVNAFADSDKINSLTANIHSCDDPKVKEAISTLSSMESTLFVWYQASSDPRLSWVERDDRSETVNQLIPIVLKAKINLGDHLIAGRCYDQAEKNFKDLITTYTGQVYAAYRERAELGLKEIWAKQK